jgi:hypothetical protein
LNQAPSYALERTSDGNTLVVTGPWTDALTKVLLEPETTGLSLNHARGFDERSLGFLTGDWGIRRLQLLDRSISDLAPIGRLGTALEDLSVEAGPEAELDLSPHPRLLAIAGEWGLLRGPLQSAPELEQIVTWSFDEIDLHSFRDMVHLERLTIKDAPHLESLSGVASLPSLQCLSIIGGPQLSDIGDLSETAASLTHLELQGCRRIGSIDGLGTLRNLRFLGLGDCGDIDTLSPVASMSQLEKLYAWGSTRVLDDDLNYLARLPALAEVRMQDRRSYKPRVREFPPRSLEA